MGIPVCAYAVSVNACAHRIPRRCCRVIIFIIRCVCAHLATMKHAARHPTVIDHHGIPGPLLRIDHP